MKVTVCKEGSPAIFSIEATGIKTAGDVKEAIFQLQQMEKQMKGGFVIEEGRISERVSSPGIDTDASVNSISGVHCNNVLAQGHFVSADDIKVSYAIDSDGIFLLPSKITLEGHVSFDKFNNIINPKK